MGNSGDAEAIAALDADSADRPSLDRRRRSRAHRLGQSSTPKQPNAQRPKPKPEPEPKA